MSFDIKTDESPWLKEREDKLLEEVELLAGREFYDFDTQEAARDLLKQYGRDYTRYILENVIPCRKNKTTYTIEHKDMDNLLALLKEGKTTNG